MRVNGTFYVIVHPRLLIKKILARIWLFIYATISMKVRHYVDVPRRSTAEYLPLSSHYSSRIRFERHLVEVASDEASTIDCSIDSCYCSKARW